MANLDMLEKEKPYFNEGEKVTWKVSESIFGTGVIRGLVSEGLLDFWIVEVFTGQGLSAKSYPYTCISVPHTLLQKIGCHE